MTLATDQTLLLRQVGGWQAAVLLLTPDTAIPRYKASMAGYGSGGGDAIHHYQVKAKGIEANHGEFLLPWRAIEAHAASLSASVRDELQRCLTRVRLIDRAYAEARKDPSKLNPNYTRPFDEALWADHLAFALPAKDQLTAALHAALPLNAPEQLDLFAAPAA